MIENLEIVGILQVSIPSQRRYVKYWENALSYTKGVPPTVKLPQSCKRELRRIRLYDTINIESIFFVLSELQRVSTLTHIGLYLGASMINL